MISSRRKKGAILLMVLMVSSILFVLVGQFTGSVTVDNVLARNFHSDAQVTCDVKSAIAVFAEAVLSGDPPNPLEVELASGDARVEWSDESTKFNVNSLLGRRSREAEVQIERLFSILERFDMVAMPGLAGHVSDHLLTLDRPLGSLGELLAVEGMTREVLYGEDGRSGLSEYVTVYSDGTVNYEKAPLVVFAALDEGVRNQRTAENVKDQLSEPSPGAPGEVKKIANRVRPFVSDVSTAFRLIITLEGRTTARKVEAAVRIDEGIVRTVLYNELGEYNARDNE